MSVRQRCRVLGLGTGLIAAVGVVALVVRARGGYAYDLRFGTAFSHGEGVALIAAAVVAAMLLSGVRWAALLLASFAILVVVLGVTHPCQLAFQDTPHPDRCSVSASASALGLYLPLSALVCAAAGWLVPRAALTPATSARLLGVAGAVVLISLWLPWYRATDEGRDYTQTGWQAFQRVDVYLVVVAAFACMLSLRTLGKRARDAGRFAAAVSVLALSGAGLVFYRLFTAADPPSSGYAPRAAMYVALAALIALAFASAALHADDRHVQP
jgi:hypothetical protein